MKIGMWLEFTARLAEAGHLSAVWKGKWVPGEGRPPACPKAEACTSAKHIAGTRPFGIKSQGRGNLPENGLLHLWLKPRIGNLPPS